MMDDTYHNPGEGRSSGLRTCGTGVKLHDFGQTIGSGHPRVKRLKSGTWQVRLAGLSPRGYGETLEDAFRDCVKRIKGHRTVVFMGRRYDVPTNLVFL